MIVETIRQGRSHVIDMDELLEGDVFRPVPSAGLFWYVVTSVSAYTPRRICSRVAKPEEVKL